jgi:hypothetical protein
MGKNEKRRSVTGQMRRVNKIMFLVMALTGYVTAIFSQNLDSMPQAQRDSLLISLAKEVVLRYAPLYYREYKEPVIERLEPPEESMNSTDKDAGRILYRVFFPYDKTREQLSYDYAAFVGIWEDTGKPSGIQCGVGGGRIISESEWESDTVVKQSRYSERWFFPKYDMNHPGKKEPINIDELRQKGYEEREDGQWVKTGKDISPNIDLLKRMGYEEINGQWIKTKKDVNK